MSALIVGLWVLGCIAKAATITRLVQAGVWSRYPVLMAALAYSTMRSAYCLSMLAAMGWPGYRAAWPATRPLELMLGAAVGLEVLYVMARHYPAPWRVLALVAAPVSLLGAAAGAGVATPLGAGERFVLVMAVGRAVHTMTSVVVVLSGGLLRWAEPQMRPNVSRYAGGAAVCLVSAAAGGWLMGVGGYWWVAAGQIVSAAVPLLGLRLWAGMDARGEWYAPSKVMSAGAGR